jgi:hypothetical protein
MKLFRVRRATFLYLVESLSPQLEQVPPPSLARAIPTRFMSVGKQLAVTLYKLGHGVSNFGVGELFGIGTSTVSDVVWRVSEAIAEVEGPLRIRWPQAGEERAAAIAGMQAAHGLPNCIGAIDCTHIVHDAPGGYLTTDYFDRERFDHNYSTVVQLVGDVSDLIAAKKFQAILPFRFFCSSRGAILLFEFSAQLPQNWSHVGPPLQCWAAAAYVLMETLLHFKPYTGLFSVHGQIFSAFNT